MHIHEDAFIKEKHKNAIKISPMMHELLLIIFYLSEIIMKKSALLINFAVILSLGLFAVGCASITTGTYQLVTITSNVDGATILLDGVKVGKTPFTGEIKNNGKILQIEKEGYKSHTISLSKSIEGMFWGNIITGGTVGSITDFATGAAFQYAPASYQVELKSGAASVAYFKQSYELKKYAMLNMSNISIDLANNGGPYLESVIYLAKMENNKNSAEIIRNILVKSEGDQVNFGNLIVKLI